MNHKEIRFKLSFEEYELFNSLKSKRGFKEKVDYFRFLISKDREQSSLTAAETLLKNFQERFEEDSYMTLRIVKTALMLLYRNSLYLQDGKEEDVRELFRTKSLENVNNLYKSFEEDFKKGSV